MVLFAHARRVVALGRSGELASEGADGARCNIDVRLQPD
jgi:hypothetical protein